MALLILTDIADSFDCRHEGVSVIRSAVARQVLGVIFLFFLSFALPASQVSENQVRAGFLYNFALFVTWPDAEPKKAPPPPIRFCVMGNGRLTQLLRKTTRGERIGGRAVSVETVKPADELTACRVLYLDASLGARRGALIRSLDAAPVLTVGNDREFVEDGGMIGLARVGRRIKPVVNPTAARSAGLRISSKLLRLADIVSEEQAGGRP